MPVLKWSKRAWLATNEVQRMRFKNLFDALLRNQPQAGEHQPDTLNLDLPGEEDPYYQFIAEKCADVWQVEAKVKRPDLKIRFHRIARL